MCDWCYGVETNWHVVTFKNKRYSYVHKDKKDCKTWKTYWKNWKPTNKGYWADIGAEKMRNQP